MWRSSFKLKLAGKCFGRYLLVPSTTLSILFRVSRALLTTVSNPVILVRISSIFLMFTVSDFHIFLLKSTSFEKLMSLCTPFVIFCGTFKFCKKMSVVCKKSVNFSVFSGMNPRSFLLNLAIVSTTTFVMLSNCLRRSSAASATVCIRSFGKSFLKLAEALKAALPFAISNPYLRR